MNNDWRQETTNNAYGASARYQGNAYSYQQTGGDSRRAYYNGEEAYSQRASSAQQDGYTPYTARHAAPQGSYQQSAYRDQSAYDGQYQSRNSYQGQSAYQGQTVYQGAYQAQHAQTAYQQPTYQSTYQQQTAYRPAYQQQSYQQQAAYRQPSYQQQSYGYRQDSYSYASDGYARTEDGGYSDYQRPSYGQAPQDARQTQQPSQNTGSYRPPQEDSGYHYSYQREEQQPSYRPQSGVYPPQPEERSDDPRYTSRARREENPPRREEEPVRREEPETRAPEEQPAQDNRRTDSGLHQPVRQTPQQRLERMRIAGEAALRAQGYQEADANQFMNTGMIHLDAVVGNLNQNGLNQGGVDPVISAQQTARMAVIKQAQMDAAPLQQPTGSMPHSRPDFSMEDYEQGKPAKRPVSGALRNIIEWVIVLSAAIALAFLIRTFVCSFYRVDGPSMQPTLYTDERLFVNKIGYRFGEIDRYDVVICHYPDSEDYYVKRVIGLPGDTVSIDRGQVCINGMVIDEPYVELSDETGMAEVTLGAEEYLVFGDNRSNSMDSRSIGPLTRDQIIGHAVFVTWPIKSFKRLPTPEVAETPYASEDAAVEEEPIVEELDDAETTEDAVDGEAPVDGAVPAAVEETPVTVGAPAT